jgi:hypothetical protein
MQRFYATHGNLRVSQTAETDCLELSLRDYADLKLSVADLKRKAISILINATSPSPAAKSFIESRLLIIQTPLLLQHARPPRTPVLVAVPIVPGNKSDVAQEVRAIFSSLINQSKAHLLGDAGVDFIRPHFFHGLVDMAMSNPKDLPNNPLEAFNLLCHASNISDLGGCGADVLVNKVCVKIGSTQKQGESAFSFPYFQFATSSTILWNFLTETTKFLDMKAFLRYDYPESKLCSRCFNFHSKRQCRNAELCFRCGGHKSNPLHDPKSCETRCAWCSKVGHHVYKCHNMQLERWNRQPRATPLMLNINILAPQKYKYPSPPNFVGSILPPPAKPVAPATSHHDVMPKLFEPVVRLQAPKNIPRPSPQVVNKQATSAPVPFSRHWTQKAQKSKTIELKQARGEEVAQMHECNFCSQFFDERLIDKHAEGCRAEQKQSEFADQRDFSCPFCSSFFDVSSIIEHANACKNKHLQAPPEKPRHQKELDPFEIIAKMQQSECEPLKDKLITDHFTHILLLTMGNQEAITSAKGTMFAEIMKTLATQYQTMVRHSLQASSELVYAHGSHLLMELNTGKQASNLHPATKFLRRTSPQEAARCAGSCQGSLPIAGLIAHPKEADAKLSSPASNILRQGSSPIAGLIAHPKEAVAKLPSLASSILRQPEGSSPIDGLIVHPKEAESEAKLPSLASNFISNDMVTNFIKKSYQFHLAMSALSLSPIYLLALTVDALLPEFRVNILNPAPPRDEKGGLPGPWATTSRIAAPASSEKQHVLFAPLSPASDTESLIELDSPEMERVSPLLSESQSPASPTNSIRMQKIVEVNTERIFAHTDPLEQAHPQSLPIPLDLQIPLCEEKTECKNSQVKVGVRQSERVRSAKYVEMKAHSLAVQESEEYPWVRATHHTITNKCNGGTTHLSQ